MSKRNPDQFATDLHQAITQRISESEGRKALVSRKLRTVLHEAGGWSKRGSANLVLIAAALQREGVYVYPDLADPALTLDHYLWFSLTPIRRRPPQPGFATESDLVRFMADNYPLLFRGIPELADLKLVDIEVEYQRSITERRADMLFARPNGERVAVEVEVGEPQENSAFQVRKYMTASKAALGVLISNRPQSAEVERDVLRELHGDPSLPTLWLQYKVSVSPVRQDPQ